MKLFKVKVFHRCQYNTTQYRSEKIKHFFNALASKYIPGFSSWTTGYYSYHSYK